MRATVLLAPALALAACSPRAHGPGGDDDGGGSDNGDGGIAIPIGGNPFVDATGYVNPEYVAEVEISATAHPAQAALLRKVAAIPNAIWLDSIAKVSRLTMFLDDA